VLGMTRPAAYDWPYCMAMAEARAQVEEISRIAAESLSAAGSGGEWFSEEARRRLTELQRVSNQVSRYMLTLG